MGGGISVPPSTPPVTACINVYNDVGWLEKCLDSLQGKVEATVVVDGAYEGFPHDKPYSTDGTIELARQRADVVVTNTKLWPTEIVKRHHYLGYVREGRWWLRIDADEELVGSFEQPLAGVCYRIMLERTDGVKPYPIHALFKKGPHSRIFGTHHAVWYRRTLLPKLEDLPVYGGVTLLHHIAERNQGRIEAKGKYYRETYPVVEGEFRERFKV